MRTSEDKPRVFEKVGECLYRYTPTGAYYARIKRPGKELRRSLDTTDRRWRSEGWPSYRFGASSPQEPHSPGTHDFHLVGQDAVPTDGTPMHVEKLKGLLWAQDIARAVRFHQTVFDAEAMRQSSVLTELSLAGTTPGLHSSGEGERTWMGLSFQAANLFEACEVLRANGGTALRSPEDTPEGPAHLAMCARSGRQRNHADSGEVEGAAWQQHG